MKEVTTKFLEDSCATLGLAFKREAGAPSEQPRFIQHAALMAVLADYERLPERQQRATPNTPSE